MADALVLWRYEDGGYASTTVRERYAMSGTDIRVRYAMSGTDIADDTLPGWQKDRYATCPAILLRTPYATPGTHIAYIAIRLCDCRY
eukprot:355907-Rhodomonas_salina.3